MVDLLMTLPPSLPPPPFFGHNTPGKGRISIGNVPSFQNSTTWENFKRIKREARVPFLFMFSFVSNRRFEITGNQWNGVFTSSGPSTCIELIIGILDCRRRTKVYSAIYSVWAHWTNLFVLRLVTLLLLGMADCCLPDVWPRWLSFLGSLFSFHLPLTFLFFLLAALALPPIILKNTPLLYIPSTFVYLSLSFFWIG